LKHLMSSEFNRLKCSKKIGNEKKGECQIKSDNGTPLVNIHIENGAIEKVDFNESLLKNDGLGFKITKNMTTLLRNKRVKFDKNTIVLE